MEDVARVSGVARATLYRHFPNQGELLSELITREMAELQALLHSALPDDARCEDYLVECALIILRESPRRALTRILFEAQSAAAVSQMAINDSTIATMGADWLQPFYQRASAEGILRDWVSEAKLQEWITRILVSLISAPSKLIEDEVALREFLYDAVVPSIIQRQTADQ
jgi:AcrR family transcriptional regulator